MAAPKRPGDDPRLQLVPASGRSRLWLWVLGAVLPVALSVAASLIAMPATSTPDLFASDWHTRLLTGFNLPDQLLGPLFVAGVTLAICLLLDRMLRRQRLRLDGDGLEVVTTFYRQRLALSQLQLDRARVIELGEHPELRPWLKSNGFALPGFRSGWFRTRGLKKLFLATAGGQRLLWLPTTRGDALLLQPQRPQALLERLREMARPPSAR
jgi:hypothetical protein